MWNPILKIELLKEGRNIRLPLIIIFYNAILALVMILFMVFNAESFQGGYYYDTSSYIYQFLILSSAQIAAVFILTPFYVSGMFDSGTERKMAEQFAWIPGAGRQFVAAKILLVLLINGLLFLSALPVISLSCIYSGLSYSKIARLGLMILLFSFWSGAVSIFFYNMKTRLVWAYAGNMLVQILFFLGTIIAVELLRNFVMLLSGSQAVPAEISGICLFLMAVNPLSSYMGYYSSLTGDIGLMTAFCSYFGVDATGSAFSFLFYKSSSLVCVLAGVIFLAASASNLEKRTGIL